ncbi:MAG: phospho-N-acetylmuramoyl-pentapeptide-transferase [Spirochaetes bacterium]|jgi:phospho-N-acetylmuramoyl-pentapeptide-transferase|nr:phospho-N-acetylmuramoyl-pentapeptide-transferase [Spirochaetota bacterium]
MLYHLLLPLQKYLSFLRLFQYITFRSLYAAVTALLFVLFFGNIIIGWLRNLKFREEIRTLGPDSHQAKAGTPTMGGVIILSAILFSSLLWSNLLNLYNIVLMVATLLLGAVGFADDYIKAIKKHKDGMPGRMKLCLQVVIALMAAIIIYYNPSNEEFTTKIFIPFISKVDSGTLIDFGLFWIVFAAVTIVGASNAVNLTDGLDGLAIGSVLIVSVTLGLISYLTGHQSVAAYLNIPHIPDGGEISVFIAALAGASLGFLWFNSNPATVFMGDTGSLALGGIIGLIAVMIKKELLLFIVGGVFVVETLSVIIQVGYYKLSKKRFFKMAPIHHHFELSGWSEQKVVVRLWIIGIILAIVGLSTLKIL